AKGVKTTTFTDVEGNQARGAKVAQAIDLSPSQQQAKNLKDAVTTSNKLLAVKQKLVGLDDTDIQKQEALNKQATLYYNRLQNILNSRKVMVDGNNIGSLNKDGIKQLENLQKENALKLQTVQSGVSDKTQKQQFAEYIKYQQQQSDLFVKNYNEQIDYQNKWNSIRAKADANDIKRKETNAKKEAEINNEIINNKIKNQEKEQKRLNNLGTNVRGTITDKNLLNSANQNDLEKYLHSLFGVDQKISGIQYQFDKAGKEVITFNREIKNNDNTITKYKQTIDKTTASIRDNGGVTRDVANRNINMSERFATAMRSIPVWFGAMTLYVQALRTISFGIESITNIDTALTNLNKVTNESKETLIEFSKEANSIGKNLARTTDEVINSTAEFSRLGYELQEAKVLAQQAILYSNVGNIDEITASQSLISAIKGFNIEVDKTGRNVQHIVDIYNEVGNNYAISSAGIGEAMSRSAASLYGAGNTIEQAVAMITAANAVVQDPDTVGTALKTVSMRLRGISDEGEDVQDLVPKVREEFNKLGLEVLKDNDTFKSTYQIMDDLASKWENLTDVQKANITEVIAGKRQGNIVVSMLNNWKDAEDSLITALMSANSAIKENEKYMQSIQAKIAVLKNTLMGQWQNSLNSDTINNFVVSMTTLIRVFGNLPSIITLATTALLVWKGVAVQGAILSSLQFIGSLTTVATTVKTTTLATVGLTSAFNALKIAFATNPLGIAAVILTTLAGAFLLTKDSAEQATQALSDQTIEQIKLADNNNKRIESLTVLQAKQKRLNEEIKSGALSTEQLADKQAQLEDITKKVGLIITDEIKQRMISNGVKEDEISEIIKLINTRNEELSSQYTNQLTLSKNAINGAKDRIAAYQAEMDALKALQSSMGTKLKNDYGVVGDLQSRKPSELKDAGFINATKFFLSELTPKSSDFKEDINEYNTTTNKINELEKQLNADQVLIDNNQKILDNSLDLLSGISGNLSGNPSGNPDKPIASGGSSSTQTKEDQYQTDQYANALESLNQQLTILDFNKSKLTQTSDEYRSALSLENDLLKQKQDIIHAQADSLRTQIASGTLSQKEIDETNKTIQSLGDNWIDVQKT
ncbi:MAG: phage tail tape measure protein, partial [Burkholderiales bacterium]|nr:phage tail tape measure protein [Burkholderiales bacterium]